MLVGQIGHALVKSVTPPGQVGGECGRNHGTADSCGCLAASTHANRRSHTPDVRDRVRTSEPVRRRLGGACVSAPCALTSGAGSDSTRVCLSDQHAAWRARRKPDDGACLCLASAA